MDISNRAANMANRNPGILDKLIPVHHSITDWTFRAGQGLHLSSAQFVSSPTSLASSNINGTWKAPWVYLKDALGKCIPEGRFVTYIRIARQDAAPFRLFFRTQEFPTNFNPANCYYVAMWPTEVHFYRRTAGVDSALGIYTVTNTWPNLTWCQFRISFWEYINLALQPVLRMLVEQFIAGTWTTKATHDHINPSWSASINNRIGFAFVGTDGAWVTYIDDTEVYKRV